MNQTITTASTHPVDSKALRLQLKKEGKRYCKNRKEARERLLHTLQTNDCRDIITAVVDGDDLANAFVLASLKIHLDLLEAFLNHGMNIDIKDVDGRTALVSCEHEQSSRFLLDHNASVDVQDKFGYTALMYASMYGKTQIVQIMLEKNVNLDLQCNRGVTALMFASAGGYKETVQLLLDHGADVDMRNNVGKTALDLTWNEEVKEMLTTHVSTSYVLK